MHLVIRLYSAVDLESPRLALTSQWDYSSLLNWCCRSLFHYSVVFSFHELQELNLNLPWGRALAVVLHYSTEIDGPPTNHSASSHSSIFKDPQPSLPSKNCLLRNSNCGTPAWPTLAFLTRRSALAHVDSQTLNWHLPPRFSSKFPTSGSWSSTCRRRVSNDPYYLPSLLSIAQQ